METFTQILDMEVVKLEERDNLARAQINQVQFRGNFSKAFGGETFDIKNIF